MTQTKRNTNTMFNLTRCGLLSAMAVILFYIEIPVVAFYKLDLSTLPAILAGFAMGPWQGLAVIIIKNLVHMLGTSTACVGELADILMSCAFVIPASLIYRRQKSRKGALKAMLLGSVAMVIVSVLVNYFILIPAYQVLMNLPLDVIIGMGTAINSGITNISTFVMLAVAPLNRVKGAMISVLTILLYKKVARPLFGRNT